MSLRSLSRFALVCLLFAVTRGAVSASDKSKEASHEIDSGTFGVFAKGNRVASETFSIEQSPDHSLIKSEFAAGEGATKAVQSSELQIASNGDLRKYDWKEISPGKAQISVTTAPDALVEHTSENPQAKPIDSPFLVPASTSVVDDYFFVQVEVLAWKYLATSCQSQNGHIQCPLNRNVQIGTLNPHAHNISTMVVSFAGLDKIKFHGVDRDLNCLNLKTDSSHWTLWLDDQFKLLRIMIGDDGTEVLRD